MKQVPPEVRHIAPDIDWTRIAGLRDILIHAYFNVDLEILWDVITNKLPGLAQKVKVLLGRS